MVECSYIAELAGKQIGTIATAADLRRRAGQALRNRGVTPVKWPLQILLSSTFRVTSFIFSLRCSVPLDRFS